MDAQNVSPLGAGLQAPNCWLRYCALVVRLATGRPCRNGIATSAVKHLFVLANSFHEKAGVSQVCFSSSSPVVFSVRAEPPLSPSFHPHSFVSDFRSVHGGRSRFSRCCYLIIDLGSRLLARKLGQELVAVA